MLWEGSEPLLVDLEKKLSVFSNFKKNRSFENKCKIWVDLLVSQVHFGSDQQIWSVWRVMLDFREPLGEHILKSGPSDQWEAEEKYVRVGVRQGSQSVIVVLTWKRSRQVADYNWNRLFITTRASHLSYFKKKYTDTKLDY